MKNFKLSIVMSALLFVMAVPSWAVPPPITTSLTLHLDASDVDADGDIDSLTTQSATTTWKDKSGKANNVLKITAGITNQIPSSLNGKPVIKFIDSGFSTEDSGVITGNTSYTKFVVFKLNDVMSPNNLVSSTQTALWFANTDKIRMWHNNEDFITSDSTITTTDYHIVTARYGKTADFATVEYASGDTGFENTLRLDKVVVGSDTSFRQHGLQPIQIGHIEGDFRLNGNIAEVLVYDRALKDPEIESVEAYLNTKWFGSTAPHQNQTIAFGALADRVLGSGNVTLTATGGASGNPVVFSTASTACTVNGNVVTLDAVGTCTILADQAGNATYNSALQVPQSFEITAVPLIEQVIKFAALTNKVLGSGDVTLTATGGASGNPVVFTSATPLTCKTTGTNGKILQLKKAGLCTVKANQAANATHNKAAEVSQTFTITPIVPVNANLVISSPVDVAVVGEKFTLTKKTSSSASVTFKTKTATVCSVAASTGVVTPLKAGTCQVDASQVATTTHKAGSATVTVSVNSKEFDSILGVINGTNTTKLTKAQLEKIGLKNVKSSINYNKALKAYAYADRNNPTFAELQSAINKANSDANSSGGSSSGVWLLMIAFVSIYRRRQFKS